MNVSGITHTFLVDLLKQYPDFFNQCSQTLTIKFRSFIPKSIGNNGNRSSLIIILISMILLISIRINCKIADRNFGFAKIKRAENCGLDKNTTMISSRLQWPN
jgi:hypothetical protein